MNCFPLNCSYSPKTLFQSVTSLPLAVYFDEQGHIVYLIVLLFLSMFNPPDDSEGKALFCA